MLMQVDHGELRIKAVASANSSQLTLLKRLTDELHRLASDYYYTLIMEAYDTIDQAKTLEDREFDCGDILADVIDALDDIAFFSDAHFLNDGEFFRFTTMRGGFNA